MKPCQTCGSDYGVENIDNDFMQMNADEMHSRLCHKCRTDVLDQRNSCGHVGIKLRYLASEHLLLTGCPDCGLVIKGDLVGDHHKAMELAMDPHHYLETGEERLIRGSSRAEKIIGEHAHKLNGPPGPIRPGEAYLSYEKWAPESGKRLPPEAVKIRRGSNRAGKTLTAAMEIAMQQSENDNRAEVKIPKSDGVEGTISDERVDLPQHTGQRLGTSPARAFQPQYTVDAESIGLENGEKTSSDS